MGEMIWEGLMDSHFQVQSYIGCKFHVTTVLYNLNFAMASSGVLKGEGTFAWGGDGTRAEDFISAVLVAHAWNVRNRIVFLMCASRRHLIQRPRTCGMIIISHVCGSNRGGISLGDHRISHNTVDRGSEVVVVDHGSGLLLLHFLNFRTKVILIVNALNIGAATPSGTHYLCINYPQTDKMSLILAYGCDKMPLSKGPCQKALVKRSL